MQKTKKTPKTRTETTARKLSDLQFPTAPAAVLKACVGGGKVVRSSDPCSGDEYY